MKTCAREADCVHPNGPVLPESEFYAHRPSADGLYSLCKECQKEKSRHQTAILKTQAGHESEQLVIDKLKSLGIFAAPGKCSSETWVDVIAWGCVRIECKYSTMHKNGTFSFNFSNKDGRESDRADIVILVAELDGFIDYFILEATDPILYLKNGKQKSGIAYTPTSLWRKTPSEAAIALENARDNWKLIEEKRIEKSILLTVDNRI